MDRSCPDDSEKVGHLYVTLIVLVRSFLTLVGGGVKYPKVSTTNIVRWIGLVQTIPKRYDTSRNILDSPRLFLNYSRLF